MTKERLMLIRAAKPQTSLRIRAVWPEPLLFAYIIYRPWRIYMRKIKALATLNRFRVRFEYSQSAEIWRPFLHLQFNYIIDRKSTALSWWADKALFNCFNDVTGVTTSTYTGAKVQLETGFIGVAFDKCHIKQINIQGSSTLLNSLLALKL